MGLGFGGEGWIFLRSTPSYDIRLTYDVKPGVELPCEWEPSAIGSSAAAESDPALAGSETAGATLVSLVQICDFIYLILLIFLCPKLSLSHKILRPAPEKMRLGLADIGGIDSRSMVIRDSLGVRYAICWQEPPIERGESAR